jgi:hypothetical protein
VSSLGSDFGNGYAEESNDQIGRTAIFFFEKAGGLPRYIDKKNNKRFKSIQ